MAAAAALISDLILASRITAAAQAAGGTVHIARSPEALVEALGRGGVSLVMVDMSLPQAAAIDGIRRAAAHQPRPAVVAFYSHVETELRDAARGAGADQVLPRSAFVERLGDLLRHFGAGEA